MEKQAQFCGDCGAQLQRCFDCSLLICEDCYGQEHEIQHTEDERERQALHNAIDAGWRPGDW